MKKEKNIYPLAFLSTKISTFCYVKDQTKKQNIVFAMKQSSEFRTFLDRHYCKMSDRIMIYRENTLNYKQENPLKTKISG